MTYFIRGPDNELAENASFSAHYAKTLILGNTSCVYEQSGWNTTITYLAPFSASDRPGPSRWPVTPDVHGLRRFLVNPLVYFPAGTGTVNLYLSRQGYYWRSSTVEWWPYSMYDWDPAATWSVVQNSLSAYAGLLTATVPTVGGDFDSLELSGMPSRVWHTYAWWQLLPASGAGYFSGYYVEEETEAT